MKKYIFTSQFKKDVKREKKSHRDLKKLEFIMRKLAKAEKLPVENRDHKLAGIFKNHRECHIEPDWLLIYKIEENYIIFERTGSHAELFG